jgi:hypothetical protein
LRTASHGALFRRSELAPVVGNRDRTCRLHLAHFGKLEPSDDFVIAPIGNTFAKPPRSDCSIMYRVIAALSLTGLYSASANTCPTASDRSGAAARDRFLVLLSRLAKMHPCMSIKPGANKKHRIRRIPRRLGLQIFRPNHAELLPPSQGNRHSVFSGAARVDTGGAICNQKSASDYFTQLQDAVVPEF